MSESPRASALKRLGRRAGWILAAPIFLLFALYFLLQGLTAVGLTGTHGTFTVDGCSLHMGKRSNSFNCDGTFRSDDGRVVDDEASINNMDTNHRAGEELSVQRYKLALQAVEFEWSGYELTDGETAAMDFGGAVLSLVAFAGSIYAYSRASGTSTTR